MTEKNRGNKTLRDRDLDDLFGRESARQIAPSPDLLARIIEDADSIADTRQTAAEAPAGKPGKPGMVQNILAAIGGWPAMAGLTTATVAGIGIGLISPDALTGIADSYFLTGIGDDLGEFMPVFSGFEPDFAPDFAPEFAPEFVDEG